MLLRKQDNRRYTGGHAVSNERERRRNLRSTSHDVTNRAPTSSIYFAKAPTRKAGALHLDPAFAEAGATGAGRRRVQDAVSAPLQEEVLECFRLFDRDGDGLVHVTEVPTMLRSLGFLVLAEEVRAFEAEARRHKTTTVNFQTFSSIAVRGFPRRADPVEVLNAFHLFDREKKGSVNVDELHHLVTTLGDPLTEEDWQRLLSRTLTVRECATPVSMKSGTFVKLFCAPVEGETEWSIAAASTQPNEPLL